MAFNYYLGWTEAELLTERRMVQNQLAIGRPTETRLGNELTRTDASAAATPLEVTLERLAYALYVLYATGDTDSDTVYLNPYSHEAGVTRQNFC